MIRTARGLTAVALLCLSGLMSMTPTAGASAARTSASGAGASAARRAPSRLLGGLNITGLDYQSTPAQADAAIAVAQQLHATAVRTEVPWSVLEPLGPGQVAPAAVAFVDRLVGDAKAAGIRVIMTVDSSPCWASSAPASILSSCVPGSESAANAWPPSNPAAYANAVSYLAARYGTGGLAAIEIWNEPDQANQLYFAGPNKPQRYAALLKAAYPAIKHADPQVLVLAGSLVGSNGAFLRALYKAGIKGSYDGLAVHFYNLVVASLRAIRATQQANHDSKPLWLDEFGWSSCYPRLKTQEEQACVTSQVQGSNVAAAFDSFRRLPYVAAAMVFDLQDTADNDFGVLNGTGAHKPSFTAMGQALSSPFGNPPPVTLSLHRSGGRVTASGSGPVGDYMQLEASSGGRLRYRALFVLDRFNRYSLKLPRALGTSGLQVRVYQYGTGPAGATRRSI